MTNVTFAVPDAIHQKMKAHSEIKWSEVARRAIIDYLSGLEDDKAWRKYAAEHALKNWTDARDIFDF